eukprot:7531478-Alexandrium_andersonii.AAC.1
MGDLNCEVHEVPELHQRVTQARLFDLAALKQYTGRNEPLVTCRAHGARVAKRRDFALASPHLLSWVKSVATRDEAGYDVHVPLDVVLSPPRDQVVCCLKQCAPFAKPEQWTAGRWREA